MEGTAFAPALEGMKSVRSPEGEMLTEPFLEVCKQILPVIGTLFVFMIWAGHFVLGQSRCVWTSSVSIILSTHFPRFLMAEKFGAAMTLVKSDVGGNITVRCSFHDHCLVYVEFCSLVYDVFPVIWMIKYYDSEIFAFECRDWKPNIFPILPSSTSCTVWCGLRLRPRRQKRHPAAPMVCYGWQGKWYNCLLVVFIY